jgi:uncharacterized protein with HEPN domain
VRSDRERILDMLEAIQRVASRAARKETFVDDELVQVWVVHHLEILGEAARGVTEELRKRTPEVPWAAISAQRNLLVHAYFQIDADEVWRTVERDLPTLREQLSAILETLPE